MRHKTATLLVIALAACFAHVARGQVTHEFAWAMRLEDMRERIFSFISDDPSTQNQARQVNQEMLDLFERETGIGNEQWQQLSALYDHFGSLLHNNHQDWLSTSNPCDWHGIDCDEQGQMSLSIDIVNPSELQSTTPVNVPLDTVLALRLTFSSHDYPQLDMDYIAKLFSNLETLEIMCWSRVGSFANLIALSKIPLKRLAIHEIYLPLRLAEWLPHMKHLRELELQEVRRDRDGPDLDLRHVIPPMLEKFTIDLRDNRQHVSVLLSDDLIADREQEDGSVIHPLELNFSPSGKLGYEMECSIFDSDDREIEQERERPDGKHPLMIRYDTDKPDFAGQAISKFAVTQRRN